FNGQEKSKEIGSDSYTAEFWQYDARIGRRWNLDPVSRPGVSDYATLGNNPIIYVDPDGNDWYKNRKTGDYDWFDGSGKIDGYKHMKTGTWSRRDRNGYSYYFANSKEGLIMAGP